MTRLIQLFCLCTLLILTACDKPETSAPAPETISPTLLQVDGRSLTLEDFNQEFKQTLPAGQVLSDEERRALQRDFLIQIIDRELNLAEAERLKINVTPQEVETAFEDHRRDYPDAEFTEMLNKRKITLDEWKKELGKRLLLEKVVRQIVYDPLEIGDEEIAAYYESNRDNFDQPAQVRARQIVVASKEEGETLLGQLRRGEDFAKLAAAHSLSPDSAEGGDLGFFAKGDMPQEFDDTVFTLPVGRLSGLVKSEYGYHVFRVEERREAIQLTLEAVKDEIRERLLSEKKDAAYQRWLQQLRAKAVIDVNGALL
ncbi:MAG: hypothetical protein C0621_00335 [Desulfuromonas sp.]|mgnify:CR=1 FL=1|nr:MAG: hypothetical protein C0621_00335 [Desulfuromonas sp.]